MAAISPPQRISEEEIRPARMMADKQHCIEADRQFLLTRRAQWVDVACPACDQDDARPFGQKEGFVYAECQECGTVYTNPRPSLDVLEAFYASSQNYAYWNEHIFPATEATRRERIFRPRARRLAEICQEAKVHTGTLLDIGAAFGTFCEEVRQLALFQHVIALEPTPDLAATCRRRGFRVLETIVEKVNESEIADVVSAFEVLEHLFSPREFVTHCARLLRPGGLLILSCPNVRGFDVAALGTRSNTFDHEHLNYFHPGSLRRLVERCGMDVVEVATPGKLDAELVRKRVQEGVCSLEGQPLLEEILLRRWDELGNAFQQFLSDNCLSSHMWIVARKAGVCS